MIGCAQVTAWLPGFVGEDLPADRIESVRAHLLDCVACRREAASYLQANKALRAAVGEAAARHGSGDLHDEIHAAIMTRVEQADVELAFAVPSWSRRLALVAAALLLAAVGFWLAAGQRPATSIWERPPLFAPAADFALRAVPYAGPRFELRPVGLDVDADGRGLPNGYDPGLRGRSQLRAMVEEERVLPAVYRRTR